MNHRHVVSISAVGAVIVVVSLGSVAATGQVAKAGNTTSPSSTRTPRTEWGDPDLRGVWKYDAAISLERPAEFEGRAFLTAEEVAKRQQAEVELEGKKLAGAEGTAVGRQPLDASPIRGNEYNSTWQDTGRPRKVYKQTSLIVDPPDGKIPLTPDGLKANQRARRRYGVGPYESYLDPDTGERCLTDGVTAMMWEGPNGGHNRIAQSPGYVTILHEEYRDRRIIPVDGRPPGQVRQWLGDSVGHWEGDTLVVDTTNFLDKSHYEWQTFWQRPSETLHLVERFTRVDADTMEYKITIEDPAMFTRPWTAVIPIAKLPADTQIFEYACHEGNYAMPNLLSGSRAEAAKKTRSSK